MKKKDTKKLTNPNVGEDVEQLELSYPAGRKYKFVQTF